MLNKIQDGGHKAGDYDCSGLTHYVKRSGCRSQRAPDAKKGCQLQRDFELKCW